MYFFSKPATNSRNLTIYNMLLKEQYQVLVKSLLPYAQKKLGFNKPPVINFLDDNENSSNPLGKTGFYRPDDKSISVFITGRHPKDILRSVAHELVHYQQDCDGRLTQHMRKELHDKQYAQNNPDLRQFEEEAYLEGNMIFRDWEDNYKNKPSTIRINFKMNESKLRTYIKQLVSEIVTEEKKKKEEEQRADVSKVRDSAKRKELSKYKIAEEVEDTESISLNEWKNQELFGLLSNKSLAASVASKQAPVASITVCLSAPCSTAIAHVIRSSTLITTSTRMLPLCEMVWNRASYKSSISTRILGSSGGCWYFILNVQCTYDAFCHLMRKIVIILCTMY